MALLTVWNSCPWMELRVLQYFLAVAREQNISAAAQSLHLTQPTLSRQLRELAEAWRPWRSYAVINLWNAQ